MKRGTLSLILFLCMALCNGCLYRWFPAKYKETVHETTPAAKNLLIQTSNGSVRVDVYSGDLITLDIDKFAEGKNETYLKKFLAEDVKLSSEVFGDVKVIQIKLPPTVPEEVSSVGASIAVKIPEAIVTSVDIRTVNGAVQVNGYRGDLFVSTTSEPIELADVEGRIYLTNVNGSIKGTEVSGELIATTENKEINIESAVGLNKAFLWTANAKVTLEGSPGLAGVYYLETSNAPIELAVEAHSQITLEAQMGTGKFISDLPFSPLISANSPFYCGELNGGGGRVYLYTSNDNVKVVARKD